MIVVVYPQYYTSADDITSFPIINQFYTEKTLKNIILELKGIDFIDFIINSKEPLYVNIGNYIKVCRIHYGTYAYSSADFKLYWILYILTGVCRLDCIIKSGHDAVSLIDYFMENKLQLYNQVVDYLKR